MVRPRANSHSVSRASSSSVTLPALGRRCADVFICLPLLWIGMVNYEERGSSAFNPTAENRTMRTLVSRDMRTHRLSLLGAVVVVVAAVSGGCGGGTKNNAASTAASTGSSSSSGAVIKTVSVHETEYK